MSLRNYLHGNAVSMENVEIKTSLKLLESNYSIEHVLNPVTGDYKIKDKNANDLIAFDSSARLKSSSLNSHIESRLNPINTTLTSHTSTLASHETRLTTIENSGGGGGGGLTGAGLADVLGVSNNANNLSMTNLNDISSVSVHVGTSYMIGNSVYAETIYGNNITSMQNQINTLNTYINNLKALVASLSASLDLKDQNGNNLDVSNLL